MLFLGRSFTAAAFTAGQTVPLQTSPHFSFPTVMSPNKPVLILKGLEGFETAFPNSHCVLLLGHSTSLLKFLRREVVLGKQLFCSCFEVMTRRQREAKNKASCGKEKSESVDVDK